MELPKSTGLLTANAAAQRKGVSRQAVTLAIKERRLPAEKWGRFYMIREADLAAWEPIGHRPKKLDTSKGERE